MNIQDFIGNTAVTAKVKRIDSNPNMSDMWAGASHWLVTLKAGRFSMRVPYSQGSAHTAAPTAADVLDCLASDASGFENARSFEEWAREYGYDIDSRSAFRTFNTVARQSTRLRAMFGQDNYETLLWNVERL